MPIAVKFYKETELPSTLDSNSFYYINNGTYAEAYLTGDNGEIKYVGNSAMIRAVVSQMNLPFLDLTGKLNPAVMPLTAHNFLVVANSAARFALTSTQVQPGSEVFQIDTGTTYKLIATNPSLSSSWQLLVSAIDWSSINNKPALALLAGADFTAPISATSASAAQIEARFNSTIKSTIQTDAAGNTNSAIPARKSVFNLMAVCVLKSPSYLPELTAIPH